MIRDALKHRMTLEVETQSADGQGGFTRSWTKQCEFWAKITPKHRGSVGREVLVGDQLQSSVTHVITVRHGVDITAKHRLTHAGRVFNIRSVINVDEANMFLQILAEEGSE